MKKHYFLYTLLFLITFGATRTGFAQKEFEKADLFLKKKFSKGNIPGFAVAIVKNNKTVFAKGYGKNADGSPVNANTPFAIASLSKSMTAMAVLQLVESGKINLDERASAYLKDFPPAASMVTVRQLLYQTSGFSDISYPELSFYDQPSRLNEAIERMHDVTPLTPPGEQFHYHNPNYQFLAAIVESVSGIPFPDYLRQHIFKPSGMSHTFDAPFTDDFYHNRDVPYVPGSIYLFGMPVQKKEPRWFVEGAAGVVSTANDMARWLAVQMNGGVYENQRILSEAGIKTMQTPYPGGSYAMGWVAGENLIKHNGILWTSQAEQVILNDSGYGIVLLFNSGFSAFQNYGDFSRGIIQALEGQTPEVSYVPTVSYEILVLVLTLISVVLSTRKMKKKVPRKQKPAREKTFSAWFAILVRTLPLILLICIPYIGTAMSGRVLNWLRIFLAMPSIVIMLLTISLLNLAIIVRQVSSLLKKHGAGI